MLRLVKPWKLRYQTSSRPSRTGRLCASGARAEVLVHRMRAGQQLAEAARRRWRCAIGRPMADHSE